MRTGPRLPALDHVGHAVEDLDRWVTFCATLLGVHLLARKDWEVPYVGEIVGNEGLILQEAFFQLPNGVILEFKSPVAATGDMESHNAGSAHPWPITGDMGARYRTDARGRIRQVSIREARGHPMGPDRGERACNLRDADGISMELMEDPPDGPNWMA